MRIFTSQCRMKMDVYQLGVIHFVNSSFKRRFSGERILSRWNVTDNSSFVEENEIDVLLVSSQTPLLQTAAGGADFCLQQFVQFRPSIILSQTAVHNRVFSPRQRASHSTSKHLVHLLLALSVGFQPRLWHKSS